MKHLAWWMGTLLLVVPAWAQEGEDEFRALKKQLRETQRELEGMREKYTDQHPELARMKARIEAVKRRLAEEFRLQQERIRREAEELLGVGEVERPLAATPRLGQDGPGAPLLREMAEEVKQFLKEFEQQTMAKLEELRTSNKMEEYTQLLRDVARRTEEIRRLRKEDIEAFKLRLRAGDLERKAQGLARELREAAEEKQEEIREKLRDAMSALFDLNLESRKLEIQKMEERIAQVRKDLERLTSEKAKEIEKRMEEMLRRGPPPPMPSEAPRAPEEPREPEAPREH